MSLTVINETSVIITTGTPGPRGPQGVSGGTSLAGEDTTSGLTGTTIAIAGFLAAEDYQVAVAYAADPGKNGNLWYVKTATDFTVYHHGSTHCKFSYIASATGTGA